MSPEFEVPIVDSDGKNTSADGNVVCFPKGLDENAPGYVSMCLFLSTRNLVLPRLSMERWR